MRAARPALGGGRPVSIAAAPKDSRLAAAGPATLLTVDGHFITGGVAQLGTPGAPTAVLERLDRPGGFVSRYFAGGLRDALLMLVDGRVAPVRVESTEFCEGRGRTCRLTIAGPFTHINGQPRPAP